MNNGDILDVLQTAKERLFEKGWQKDSLGRPKGPNCLMGAVLYAYEDLFLTHLSCENAAYQALERTIGGQIDEFNDSATTTFNDVVDVIDLTIKNLVMESE